MTILGALLLMWNGSINAQDNVRSMERFEQLNQLEWTEVFLDPCTQNWQEHWRLDGRIAQVNNDPNGMSLTAGQTFKEDACHAVLWTKMSFEGDLKV